MVDKEIERELGKRVRAFRKERGLSQHDLSEKIDKTVDTVSNIERGNTFVRPATILALAKALDIGIGDLFGDPPPPKREHPLIAELVALLSGHDEEELQAVIEQTQILLKLSRGRR